MHGRQQVPEAPYTPVTAVTSTIIHCRTRGEISSRFPPQTGVFVYEYTAWYDTYLVHVKTFMLQGAFFEKNDVMPRAG